MDDEAARQDATLSDEELARRAQAGCAGAFDALVERFQPRLTHFLLSYTNRHHQDAEDLVQETLIRAYRHLGRYRRKWAFSTWLFTIAARQAVSFHRSRRRAAARILNAAKTTTATDPSPEPLRHCVEREQRQRLWQLARDVLSEDQHAMLWLRYAEQMEVRQIARVMGRTTVSVKVGLHRARSRMLTALAEREGDVAPTGPVAGGDDQRQRMKKRGA